MESGTKVTGKRHVIQTVPFLMSKLCNIGKKVDKKPFSVVEYSHKEKRGAEKGRR